MKPLQLFYEEPANDRWIPGDHLIRDLIRPLLFWRTQGRAAGYLRVFKNLCKGLQQVGIPYRINDYRYAQGHPEELVCLLGKPHVLGKVHWKNPLLAGTALYSHPSDDPTLMSRLPIRRLLVPCEWMKTMCVPGWGDKISVWPVGIDTERWSPVDSVPKTIDILLYDKIRWDKEAQRAGFVNPIQSMLEQKGLRVAVVRYGFYREEDYRALLRQSKAVIFICEHETQGLAYQEALSCGVPVFAWDSEGYWVDRDYYPHRVKFAPVTSVPYWDKRCGMKFRTLEEFTEKIDVFMERLGRGEFQPRAYILENLTLEICARRYADLAREAGAQ